MKEKIEEIVNKKLAYCPVEGNSDIYRVHRYRVEELKGEILTLIQEERKDAVEGFITDFIETGVYEGVGSIEDIMKLWRKYNAHN